MESKIEDRPKDNVKEKDVTYPIAEIFTSIQGEGSNVGKMTTFIRLAGCSVGRPTINSDTPFHETCRRFDGKPFICDTDFRRKKMMTVQQLEDCILSYNVKNVCVTGGEPFDHNLKPLLTMLSNNEINISIETSGTKEIPEDLFEFFPGLHLSVSPKWGYLPKVLAIADDIKLLVDATFHLDEKMEEDIKSAYGHVFLQPINHIHSIDEANKQKCMDILSSHPDWRLSVQLHKYLGLR